MLYFFRKTLVVLAVPFLAVVALAFKGVSAGLRLAVSLAGWELKWPPVLVDDLEDEPSSQAQPRTRAKRRGRRRGRGRR
jgi:hypothetical protein